jgi:hypothetical protein
MATISWNRRTAITALRRPALNDLAGALLKGSDGGEGEQALQDKRQ